MPFGASKVLLARPCLRSRIKAAESRRQGFGPALHTALTLQGLRKATAAPSPAHTAACLALPFTSLSGRRKCRLPRAEVPAPAASLRGPHHTRGGPAQPPIPTPQCPAHRPEHSGLCPEVSAWVLVSHAAPAHPSIPLPWAHQEEEEGSQSGTAETAGVRQTRA